MKQPKPILINTPLQRGVHRPLATGNRFNGFGTARRTVSTAPTFVRRSSTPLKWGVNEKVFGWVWLVAGGRRLSRVVICSLLAIPSILDAENWPQWRGPHFDGSTTERDLPAEFSKTNNVKWAASLPGPSAGTPIVWGDRVFVSSTDNRTKTLRAICLDTQTGKQLWEQEAGMGFKLDEKSNLA